MPETNVSAQEAIDDFLDKLIEMKGEQLSPEERLAKRKELKEQLDGMVDEEMISAVPDEKIIELDAKMEEGMSDVEIEEFLLNSGADFDEAAIRALDRLRSEYLGLDDTTDAAKTADFTESTTTESAADSMATTNTTDTTNLSGEEK